MGAPFKPSKLATLPSPVALLLGVLLGLSLLPVLKSLLGAQFLNSTCVSLCPQGGADKAHAAQGPGAAFASFVYPTWPVREVLPTDGFLTAPKSRKRAVDESVLWGYVPALDPRGLQRGLLHHGDPARLRRAVAKLAAGERTVVAAVGGSISVGRGSATQGKGIDTDWPSYIEQFAGWLAAAFPAARPTMVNKAQSGSTSNIFDACAEAMVPKDADIVVVEFAMNDGTNVDCSRDGSGTVPARASFERLLRKLQALPNRPAVIVLNSYSFIRGAMGSYLKNAENEMAIIAAYYGLPTLSVRAATFHHMLRNENGYRVDRVRTENLGESQPDELFLFDISHPYGPTGHRYMAELLIALTQLTAGSLGARPLAEEEHALAGEPLPPPIIPGNYDKKAASCVMSRAFEGVVVEKKGFKWVNERPDAESENDEKWGWIGSKPGEYVVLALDSRSSSDGAGDGASLEDALLPVLNHRALEILDSYNHKRGPVTAPLNVSAILAGLPDAEAEGEAAEPVRAEAQSQILVGHLASYEGMGRALVECVGGCTCETSVLDGWWERHASLQVMHTIRVSEHPKCRVQLTIMEESSGKGKAAGHKVKLTAALVLAGTTTEGLSKPGRLSSITRRSLCQASDDVGGDKARLTCATVKCAGGYSCKIVNGTPKCLPTYDPCIATTCPVGSECTVVDGEAECKPSYNLCAATTCAVGSDCVVVEGKTECRSVCARVRCRGGTECTVTGEGNAECTPVPNPCAYTLCVTGTTCVVEDGEAKCIDACAGVRCKGGHVCKVTKAGHPKCVSRCHGHRCDIRRYCVVSDGEPTCVSKCAGVRCSDGKRCSVTRQGRARCV